MTGADLTPWAYVCGDCPMLRLIRFAVIVVSLGVVPSAAIAQTQPYSPVEAEPTWSLELGGGAVYGFSAAGGGARKVTATPWGSFQYRQRVYGNGLDGLGYNVVKQPSFRAGVQIRPRFAAGYLEGVNLDRPDLGADVALYAFKRLRGNVVVGARAMRDITNVSDGSSLFVSAGSQTVTPVGLLQAVAYGVASDDKFMRAYYGVTAREAVATGLAAYDPDGGGQAAGAALLLMTPIGERFGVGSFVNYERLLGPAGRSPLLDDRNVYRAGVIVVRRFRGG